MKIRSTELEETEDSGSNQNIGHTSRHDSLTKTVTRGKIEKKTLKEHHVWIILRNTESALGILVTIHIHIRN